jgi:hypothetical protein
LHTGNSYELATIESHLLMMRAYAYLFRLTIIHDVKSDPRRHDHDSISVTTSSPQCDPRLLAFDGGQYGRPQVRSNIPSTKPARLATNLAFAGVSKGNQLSEEKKDGSIELTLAVDMALSREAT